MAKVKAPVRSTKRVGRRVKKKAAGQTKVTVAKLRIIDVVEFKDWSERVETWQKADKTGYRDATLLAISAHNMQFLRRMYAFRGIQAGDVVVYMSKDRKRARLVRCEMSGDKTLFGIENLSFDEISPELALSLWLDAETETLRQSTAGAKVAEAIAALEPKEKAALFAVIAKGGSIAKALGL